MFNEVIEISYFCRIPSGGLGFDELSPVIRFPSINPGAKSIFWSKHFLYCFGRDLAGRPYRFFDLPSREPFA
jgi:hypothetical protein